jgi:hypothetical protein
MTSRFQTFAFNFSVRRYLKSVAGLMNFKFVKGDIGSASAPLGLQLSLTGGRAKAWCPLYTRNRLSLRGGRAE